VILDKNDYCLVPDLNTQIATEWQSFFGYLGGLTIQSLQVKSLFTSSYFSSPRFFESYLKCRWIVKQNLLFFMKTQTQLLSENKTVRFLNGHFLDTNCVQ
jgi:hypothetical protein